jgi:hypothetical protein
MKAVASADFSVLECQNVLYTMGEHVTCNRFSSSPSNGLEWSAMLALSRY